MIDVMFLFSQSAFTPLSILVMLLAWCGYVGIRVYRDYTNFTN